MAVNWKERFESTKTLKCNENMFHHLELDQDKDSERVILAICYTCDCC